MRSTAKAHAVLILLVVGAVIAWAASGRETFTRWPDARLEAADAPTSRSEEDLLGELGIETATATGAATIESRFAFGLLPSGADPRHLLSVATVVLVATILSGAAALRARRRRQGAAG